MIATDGAFDFVICDVNLGDGLGWDVLDAVRAKSPHTKIVMISGDARNRPTAASLGVVLIDKQMEPEAFASLGFPMTPRMTTATARAGS